MRVYLDYFLFIFIVLFGSSAITAAPATTCAGAASLTLGVCDNGVYGIDNSFTSNLCTGNRTGWYKYTPSSTGSYVITASATKDIHIGVLEASCAATPVCFDISATNNDTASIVLTTGVTYYIGVSANGTFDISSICITGCTTPVFTACPSSAVVVNTTSGLCTGVATYTVTATGTPVPSLSYVFSGATMGSGSGSGSGSVFSKGNTTVTVTATNSCGAPTCVFTVTVNDGEAPVLNCATLTTINYTTDAPNCNNDTDVSIPVAVDNCNGNINGVGTRSDNASLNSPWPLGTTTITWTFTDAANNVKTCTQNVVVADNDAPTFSCPSNITVNTNNSANCEVTVPDVLTGIIDEADNCSAVTMTQSPLSGTAQTGISDGGTFTITVTATDGATPANSSSCTVTVTVNDNDAPTFTCPSNLTVNTNNSANCEVTVPDVLTGIIDEADNCSAVTMTQSPLSGTAQTGISDGGTFTITVTATDGATPANSSSCTVTVTVNDNDAPVITRTGAATINVCKNNSYTDAGATANDNCDGDLTTMIVTDNPVNTSIAGTYVVKYDVSDAAGNAATQVSRTVIVHELPIPTCPLNFSACKTGGNVNLTGASPAGGVYSGPGVSGGIFNPVVAGVGVHSITYTYTDGNGCVGACTFDITVFDPPIYNVNDNMYYCTLAEAVAAALTNDGDELQIPTGVYNDPCILINKSVMITPIGGSVTIQCLQMNGVGKAMKLGGHFTINQLTLTNGNIQTNGNNLECGTISGGSAASYVITD